MALQGKGYYIWQVKRAFEGNPGKIADAAKQAGLSHVLIKVADGIYNYNITNGVDMVPPLVAALRARGISPWGWQYIYGSNPTFEARRAVERTKQLGLDGFVVNAEAQFKAKDMDKPAKAYMQELRRGLPNFPIALSTYRYPTVHYTFPYNAFLEYCDYNMPQVYWVGSMNPAQQLQKSYNEYQSLKFKRTIVPTGAAYAEGNWSPSPLQLYDFMQAARALKLPAANFWEWQTAYVKPELWNAVSGYNWPFSQPSTPQPNPDPGGGQQPSQPAPNNPAPDPRIQQAMDLGVRLLAALNSGKSAKVAALYEKDGALVYSGKRRSGRSNVNSFYASLLRSTLPKARFSLLDAGVQGDFLKLIWKAKLGNGKTARGNDLVKLTKNGKLISLHYVAFSIAKQMEREAEMG